MTEPLHGRANDEVLAALVRLQDSVEGIDKAIRGDIDGRPGLHQRISTLEQRQGEGKRWTDHITAAVLSALVSAGVALSLGTWHPK